MIFFSTNSSNFIQNQRIFSESKKFSIRSSDFSTDSSHFCSNQVTLSESWKFLIQSSDFFYGF